MIELFFQSLLIGYSGAMMPGSLLTYTIEKSIRTGAKAGLLVSIGHALLELLLIILLFLGLGKLLSLPTAQIIIGMTGGLALAYFGITMIRDVALKRINIDLKQPENTNLGNMIAGGAIISASNPYFIIWWAAVGLGLIMKAYQAFGLLGILLFYFGHIAADFSWYMFISALISKTRRFMSLRIYQVIIITLGFCLIGFGTGFLLSSFKLL